LAKAWLTSFNPLGAAQGEGLWPSVPTILGQKIMDLARNKNSFTGRPIVPLHLKGRPAAEQFDAFTSETAKRVGEVSKISPMQIDYMLRIGLFSEIILSLDMLLDRTDEPAHVLEVAAHLKDMLDTYPPDVIAAEREAYLKQSGLTPDEQNLAEDISLREDRIPFFSALKRRFSNKRGGQLYWTGWERAVEALEADPEQTKEAAAKMASFARTAEQEQYVLDTNHLLTPQEWRDGRRIISNGWKLLFAEIKRVYPLAVQADPEKMGEFSTLIATLGGDIEDPRARAEILYAGWRAITPPVDPKTKTDDVPAFFGLRDQYQASLTEGDRQLLRKRILDPMNPVGAQFERDLALLQPYFAIKAQEFDKHPRARLTLERIDDANRRGNQRLVDRLSRDSSEADELKEVEAEISRRKLEWRDNNTLGDATLRFWGYVPATRPDSTAASIHWEMMVREWRTR
jgi:hypothetical protein